MFELCIAAAIVGAIFHHWSVRHARPAIVLEMPDIPEARVAGTTEDPPYEDEPEILCSCHHIPIRRCAIAMAIDAVMLWGERSDV